jgi:multisubunit Na+/H+ antiporter MnhG subunit
MNALTTACEVIGAALLVAGVAGLFGPWVALVVAGLLLVAFGVLVGNP